MKPIKAWERWAVFHTKSGMLLWVNNRKMASKTTTELHYASVGQDVRRVEIRELPRKEKQR